MYCWCQTPEGVVSPRRAITRAQPEGAAWVIALQQSCLIPIITWCHHFYHSKNILLMKSNLKFESRATAVSVAMSPRYSGGKYRSRLHPRSRKCACQFFCGRLGVWNRTAPDRRRLLPVATTKLIMRCVYKLNFRYTLSFSNENDKFYTTMIYPCFSRSVCFSMGSPAWWRFSLCSSGNSLVSRVPMTWRSARARANFKCDVADVNK